MEKNAVAGRSNLVYVVRIGLLSAIAFILMYLEFRVPFTSFLKMDFGDVPAMIAGFAMGPLAGVAVQFIKNLIHFISKAETMGVGSLANLLTGIALVVPASLIYRYNRTRRGALWGMLAGTAVMTVGLAAANYYIFIPLYETVMGYDIDKIISSSAAVNPFFGTYITDLRSLVIAGIVPFNILKGLAVSLVTFILYKHISRILK